ncbi:hypothetical protein GGH94_000939 [Coemansia aciculifera]|uniref:DM14 domain-containing protein n=1 Tax=Coemansia aciculifera TaxID=417176 RepID=A0A9W8M5F6_9FUNG|nr:hypothetical protein GGH94_000939 [Coemansia aciculifera]
MYLIAGRSSRASGAGGSQRSRGNENTPTPSGRDHSSLEYSFDDGIGEYGHEPYDLDGSDDVVDVDDGDYNDPELLSQLEALRAEMGLSAPVPRQKPEEPVVAYAQPQLPPAHGTGFEDDDNAIDNVEVTEEDMADPLLLSELSKLAPSGASAPLATAAASKITSAETGLPAIQPSAVGSDGEATLEALTARQQQLKTSALAAKRQGDMDRARELLIQMKEVQASMKLLQSSQQIVVDVASSLASETSRPDPSEIISARLAAQSSVNSPTLSRARDTPERAAQAPRSTKSTPRQPATDVTAAKAQPRLVLDDEIRPSKDEAMSFAAMRAELESQVAKASRLATYFLKAGDKPAALEFHRLKKRAATDLATVNSYEANGRSLPPPFLYKDVKWTAPVEQRRDISASELQIAIKRMVSDGDLAATLGGQSDFYIQWELGWPRDKGHKAYTRTMKYAEFESSCGDLDVGYRCNVDFVDRQHTRPLLRWLERGRLTVELYKYMGLLWGSRLVGRASLPLSELRTKSEAAALLEIKAGSDALGRTSKPLPGGPVFIDLAARLRLPLSNKPESESHVERWIYVESQEQQQQQQQQRHEPASVSNRPQPAVASEPDRPSTPQQPVTIEPAIDTTDTDTKQAVSEAGAQVKEEPPLPDKSDSSSSKRQPADDDTSADDIAIMLDTVDGLFSNATLELELAQLPARLSEAKDKETASQIRDLEAAIKLRMSIIAAQVGAGVLSIQDYMDSVSTELSQAKEWALTANRSGRKDLALRALKRVKAMQGELGDMKAAMDAESE